METTLAILMVLGIFVGFPALIGIAIASVYLLSDRRARRAARVKAMAKTLEEARQAPPTKAPTTATDTEPVMAHR